MAGNAGDIRAGGSYVEVYPKLVGFDQLSQQVQSKVKEQVDSVKLAMQDIARARSLSEAGISGIRRTSTGPGDEWTVRRSLQDIVKANEERQRILNAKPPQSALGEIAQKLGLPSASSLAMAGLGIGGAGLLASILAPGFRRPLDVISASAKLGGSIGDADRVLSAAQAKGVDIDVVADKVASMREKLIGAARGKNEEAGFFAKAMGLGDPEQLALKPLASQLLTVADGFDRLKTPAEKAAAAIALFGKNGREMLAVLTEMQNRRNDKPIVTEEDAGRFRYGKEVYNKMWEIGGQWATGAASWAGGLMGHGDNAQYGAMLNKRDQVQQAELANSQRQFELAQKTRDALAAAYKSVSNLAMENQFADQDERERERLRRDLKEQGVGIVQANEAVEALRTEQEARKLLATERGVRDYEKYRGMDPAEAAYARRLEEIEKIRRTGQQFVTPQNIAQREGVLTSMKQDALREYISSTGITSESLADPFQASQRRMEQIRRARNLAQNNGMLAEFGGIGAFNRAEEQERLRLRRSVGLTDATGEYRFGMMDLQRQLRAGNITQDEYAKLERNLRLKALSEIPEPAKISAGAGGAFGSAEAYGSIARAENANRTSAAVEKMSKDIEAIRRQVEDLKPPQPVNIPA